MNDITRSGVHWSFWLIGMLALLWNIGGAVNYVMQMNPEALASYPESHRAIIDGRPVWATGGFAIAVFVGALGALLLLLKKSVAGLLFVLSLLGAIAATVHTLDVATATKLFTPSEVFIMAVLPVIVAAALIWYARFATAKGWIS